MPERITCVQVARLLNDATGNIGAAISKPNRAGLKTAVWELAGYLGVGYGYLKPNGRWQQTLAELCKTRGWSFRKVDRLLLNSFTVFVRVPTDQLSDCRGTDAVRRRKDVIETFLGKPSYAQWQVYRRRWLLRYDKVPAGSDPRDGGSWAALGALRDYLDETPEPEVKVTFDYGLSRDYTHLRAGTPKGTCLKVYVKEDPI